MCFTLSFNSSSAEEDPESPGGTSDPVAPAEPLELSALSLPQGVVGTSLSVLAPQLLSYALPDLTWALLFLPRHRNQKDPTPKPDGIRG